MVFGDFGRVIVDPEMTGFVEANAAKESPIPRRQLCGSGAGTPYLASVLEATGTAEPVEVPVHEQDQVSTTDRDSTEATKGGILHHRETVRLLQGEMPEAGLSIFRRLK